MECLNPRLFRCCISLNAAFCTVQSPVGLQIRTSLRASPKNIANRYCQLLSGHAIIAPIPQRQWKWTASDSCWWCNRGRQSPRTSLQRVGDISRGRNGYKDGGPGKNTLEQERFQSWHQNLTLGELLGKERFIDAVLAFLVDTKVGTRIEMYITASLSSVLFLSFPSFFRFSFSFFLMFCSRS